MLKVGQDLKVQTVPKSMVNSTNSYAMSPKNKDRETCQTFFNDPRPKRVSYNNKTEMRQNFLDHNRPGKESDKLFMDQMCLDQIRIRTNATRT